MKFVNREEAGRVLAEKLEKYKNLKDTIVLGLPRGGVVVAFAIASRLRLPLDIMVVRKIGAPENEEFAIGAIDESGNALMNEEILGYYKISQEYIEQIKIREQKEALRRLKVYRGKRPPLELKDKTVILVDDGIATGFTMRAAIKSAKAKGAKKVIVAIPVAPPDCVKSLGKEVDELVVLDVPVMFMAVGQFYEDFPQTSDEEVIDLLYRKALRPSMHH